MLTITEWHKPIPALTTEQMREVDRAMIEDFGIALIQMMENAGRHLATLARNGLGGVERKCVIVLAGRGNNGGGGLVAARRLANWGARVSIALAARPEDFNGVPAHQLSVLEKIRVPIEVAASSHFSLPNADLILDALIGYGLRGAPTGATAELIRAANSSGAPILALDVPSGLDTTTGAVFDPCVRASAILTLALPKVGLLHSQARGFVGELFVADIGVPPQVYARMNIRVPNVFGESDVIHWRTQLGSLTAEGR